MIDGSQRVEFDDVEVLGHTDFVLKCRVRGKIIGVPPRQVLPGTTVARTGDRGRLVLPRDVALNIGLL